MIPCHAPGRNAPPQIPHRVDTFLPIVAADNQCLDCHDVPKYIDKPMNTDRTVKSKSPMSRDHYASNDLDEVAGARFTCTQCHVPQSNASAAGGEHVSLSKMDNGRRAFLRGSLLTRRGPQLGGAATAAAGASAALAPGTGAGTHCARLVHNPCVAACEPDIIQLHPADHDLAGYALPGFRRIGLHLLQGLCRRPVPLKIQITEPVNPRIGTAQLNRDTCIAWDDVICMSCHGRCDYQAISTEHQRRAQIDTDRCTGCGMCVGACPVGALSIG